MEISAPSPEDAGQLAETLVESVIAGYAGLFDEDRLRQLAAPEALRERTKGLMERIVEGSEVFIAAKTHERVVGWAGIYGDSDQNVELESFYLRPSSWGTGIADQILERVSHAARSRGSSQVVLWTLTDNGRARRIYERNGYLLGAERRVISYLGKEVEQVRFRKTLT
jgi:GNAT superfamily N-acetyltransferase